jgi:hypothetical protein
MQTSKRLVATLATALVTYCPASTISSGDDSHFCRSFGLIIGPP